MSLYGKGHITYRLHCCISAHLNLKHRLAFDKTQQMMMMGMTGSDILKALYTIGIYSPKNVSIKAYLAMSNWKLMIIQNILCWIYVAFGEKK